MKDENAYSCHSKSREHSPQLDFIPLEVESPIDDNEKCPVARALDLCLVAQVVLDPTHAESAIDQSVHAPIALQGVENSIGV
jgi:hypothetical protein